MRHVAWGLVAAVATGCAGQSVEFQHTSELEVPARGVAMRPDGFDAQVGMYGTTCRVTVSAAQVGADVDFPSDQEVVQDGGLVDGELAVVVTSPDGVHLNFPDRGYDGGVETTDLPTALQARVFDDGVATLDAACGVSWAHGASRDVTSVGVGGVCDDAGFAALADGRVVIANGDVVIVSPSGEVTNTGATGDLVVRDTAASAVYVATRGDHWVHALEEDGTLRWSVDVGGAVVTLSDMGGHAQAAVMIEFDNGTGELVVLDGFTGEAGSRLATPTAAEGLHASANGGALAMVLPRSVHFFSVRSLD